MNSFGPSPLSDVLTLPDEIIGWGVLCTWAAFFIYKYRRSQEIVWVIGLAILTRILFIAVNTYFYTLPVDPFESIAAETARKGIGEIQANYGMGYRMYVSFCSAVYFLVGRNPLLLQVINAVMAIHSILLLTKITIRRCGNRVALGIGVFLAIMPTFVVFSTVILRDSIIIYLLTLAVWWLDRVCRSTFVPGLWLSGLCIVGIMLFHVCGSILMLFWVLVIFSLIIRELYSRREKLSWPQSRHLVTAVAIAIIGLVISFRSTETGFQRLLGQTGADHSSLTSITLAGNKVNLGEARGAYLMDTDNSSLSAKITNLPRRAVYFLFAPFPWNISNSKDFLGFCDSLIQALIIAAMICLLVTKRFSTNFIIEASLYLMLVAGFSLAVSNYGTAARHRLKLLVPGIPVLALAFQTRKPVLKDETQADPI